MDYRAAPPLFPVPLHDAPAALTSGAGLAAYEFPYPTALVPVPYDADTSLVHLLQQVIPTARAARTVAISAGYDGGGMELDGHGHVPAVVVPDGLLLYVAGATYEPGTSPLSSWVPIEAYDVVPQATPGAREGPLDMFER